MGLFSSIIVIVVLILTFREGTPALTKEEIKILVQSADVDNNGICNNCLFINVS
jgi:hypothetical protein